MSAKLRSFFAAYGQTILIALLLIAATLWLFWPATEYRLLNFDDDRYVTNNAMVTGGLTLEGIRWAFKFIYESYWLPLVWISYMLDSSLFGANAFGYHFTNILLHALNAGLLFAFLKNWTRRLWPSLIVAALFAFHPLRVESVAWVTERKDVLSAFFLLLCLFSYGKFTRKPIAGRDTAAALLMALGLMTKPILVTVPFLLLLLDLWPFGRWANAEAPLRNAWTLIREKVLFWALMLVFIFMTYYTQRSGSAIHSAEDYPWAERILAIPVAYLFYLEKTFLPTKLSVVYGELSVTPLRILVALAVLIGATVVALWSGRRSKAVPVGWIWFGLLLGPVIGIIRVGAVHVADRFTYLPSIGLAICVTWFAADVLPPRKWIRNAAGALALLAIFACGWQTRNVLPHWKDSLAAFANVIQYLPENALVNNNYGEALLAAGREEEALKYFEKASALIPTSAPFKANVSVALTFLGRNKEAIAMMEDSMQGPNSANPYFAFSRGLAWVDEGHPEKGIPFMESACAAAAMPAPAWQIELAGAYLRAGRMEAATNQFKRLREAGRANFASFEGVCFFYANLWNEGHSRHAWSFFDAITTLHSNNVAILNNAAWLLATAPPPDLSPAVSLRLAESARDLSTNGVPANIMDTLAVAYAANGDFTNALLWINKAYDIAIANNATIMAKNLDKRRRAFLEGKPWTHIVAPD
ncbi:MAG: hypothetical protein H3C50_09605 [Kiritimatiellae bacterium]|nr:hypothetical protein [Kiritimatiellia bacterium]